MDPSSVFLFANYLAIPMWILMIFLPDWKVTSWLVERKIIPIVLATVYAIYISLAITSGDGMDFGSLEAVMDLFTEEQAVLAGWIHYLVFDLLIGMWMLNQKEAIGIHRVLMAICLFFTFILGPIGFLLFTLFKRIKKSKA